MWKRFDANSQTTAEMPGPIIVHSIRLVRNWFTVVQGIFSGCPTLDISGRNSIFRQYSIAPFWPSLVVSKLLALTILLPLRWSGLGRNRWSASHLPCNWREEYPNLGRRDGGLSSLGSTLPVFAFLLDMATREDRGLLVPLKLTAGPISIPFRKARSWTTPR